MSKHSKKSKRKSEQPVDAIDRLTNDIEALVGGIQDRAQTLRERTSEATSILLALKKDVPENPSDLSDLSKAGEAIETLRQFADNLMSAGM